MARQPYPDRKGADISDREEVAPGVPATTDRRSEAERTMQGEPKRDRRGASGGHKGQH